jgi:hypothetical protein
MNCAYIMHITGVRYFLSGAPWTVMNAEWVFHVRYVALTATGTKITLFRESCEFYSL